MPRNRPPRLPPSSTAEPSQLSSLLLRWWGPINAPVIGERGELIAVIHQIMDVSERERERAEAEVRSHAARQAGVTTMVLLQPFYHRRD